MLYVLQQCLMYLQPWDGLGLYPETLLQPSDNSGFNCRENCLHRFCLVFVCPSTCGCEAGIYV